MKLVRDNYNLILRDLSAINNDYIIQISTYPLSKNPTFDRILFPVEYGFSEESELVLRYDSIYHPLQDIIDMLDFIHGRLNRKVGFISSIRIGFLLRTYGSSKKFLKWCSNYHMEIYQDDEEPQYEDKDLLNNWMISHIDSCNWIDLSIDNSQIPHKNDSCTLYIDPVSKGYLCINNRTVCKYLKEDLKNSIIDELYIQYGLIHNVVIQKTTVCNITIDNPYKNTTIHENTPYKIIDTLDKFETFMCEVYYQILTSESAYYKLIYNQYYIDKYKDRIIKYHGYSG